MIGALRTSVLLTAILALVTCLIQFSRQNIAVSVLPMLGNHLLAKAGMNSSFSHLQSATRMGGKSAAPPKAPRLQLLRQVLLKNLPNTTFGAIVQGTMEAAAAAAADPAQAEESDSSCAPSCRPGSLEWNKTGIPVVPYDMHSIQFQPGREFRPSARPAGCFGVLAVLAREEHVLVEWLEHYYSEGAGHIYLGNNNLPGTVEYSIFRRQVEPYEKAGILTWWQMPPMPKTTMNKKVLWLDRVWNKAVLPRIRADNLVKWLLVVDLDEFAYAADVSGKMSDFLCNPRTDEVTQFCIPYNMYGTSGLLRQPACIVPHFVKRDSTRAETHGKCVARIANITWLSVHYHHVQGGDRLLPGSPWAKYSSRLGGKAIKLRFYRAGPSNWFEWPLRLNHYQMQSLQQYRILRNNRSKTESISSQGANSDDSRRLVWDQHAVKDDLLASKKHWKKLWWDCDRAGGPLEWSRFANVKVEP